MNGCESRWIKNMMTSSWCPPDSSKSDSTMSGTVNQTRWKDKGQWAMLDSGASVHVVRSAEMLTSVTPLVPPIMINTVGGDLAIESSGMWSGIGEALVNPLGGSNIVSLSSILRTGHNAAITDVAFILEHPSAPGASVKFELQRSGLFEARVSEIEEFGRKMSGSE